ncbi:MAG: c-type cytochrome [Verrucomicrobiae bacterium]|nr:c-type cytochrome [Verrucomicrobiae bacterium]
MARVVRTAGDVAQDAAVPASRRVAAISLIGTDPSPENLGRLCALAGDSEEAIRHAALAALKPLRDPEIAARILARWTRVPPSARPDLVSLLLDREDWTIPLLDAVRERVVDPQELGQAERQRLFANAKPRVQTLANEVLPPAAVSGRAEVLEHYRASLSLTGDATRGAAVFAQNCAACHLLNGIGHSVGPDLVPLRSREPEYWMKNILDPNAVVEPRFVSYTVELADERTLSGLIRNESSTSLTVVSGSGISETVPRSAVADIRASAQSLMPEGLEQGIPVPQMADLIAFLRNGRERKQMAGNQPETIQAGTDGVLLLPASKAEIYGDDITFESEFRIIGMWHGEQDHVAWTLQVEKPGRYDVYLDSACASSAAGNPFVIEVGEQRLSGKVTETGPDWSRYRQAAVGAVQLASGRQRVVFRPSGAVQNALMDLRTVALAPAGQTPKWPQPAAVAVDTGAGDDVLRDPASLARFLLDASRPEPARSAILTANPQYAAALIREMSRDLSPGSPEEYTRIPWLWRVALDCGRRNDASQIAAVVEAALPAEGEALRDWQAVVLGGGIINGLSQRDAWPAPRLEAILESQTALHSRWRRALTLSAAMADDAKVSSGTRYDALRMIPLLGWDAAQASLQRYLAEGQNEELQMGAVSGLSDLEAPQVAPVLIAALKYLKGQNRELALDALLRSPERRAALLESIQSGAIPRDAVVEERMIRLRQP